MKRTIFMLSLAMIVLLASLAVARATPDEFLTTAIDTTNLGFFRDTSEEVRKQFLDLSAQTEQLYPASESGTLSIPSKLDGELPIDWLYVPAAVTQRKLDHHGRIPSPVQTVRGLPA